jgi:hypothetical protein
MAAGHFEKNSVELRPSLDRVAKRIEASIGRRIHHKFGDAFGISRSAAHPAFRDLQPLLQFIDTWPGTAIPHHDPPHCRSQFIPIEDPLHVGTAKWPRAVMAKAAAAGLFHRPPPEAAAGGCFRQRSAYPSRRQEAALF